MAKAYEFRFVEGIATVLKTAGVCILEEPVYPYYGVIRGSTSSEADGVIFVEQATIILEIDKKGFPSDTGIKYHRALTQHLLKPRLQSGRLILVHAFVTKNIRPLRVENAQHVGELLVRDFGVQYISAQTKNEDIDHLVQLIRPRLPGALSAIE